MKTHDLTKKQTYPIVHKWVSNSTYINIMSNAYISKGDNLLYNGVKYKVLSGIPNRYCESPAKEIIQNNNLVKETSIFYSLIVERV